MEKMKLTENMVKVLNELAKKENASAFAKEIVIENKTFNSVNATLASLAGDKYLLVSKSKAICGDKFLTKYTLTEMGRDVLNELNTPVEKESE